MTAAVVALALALAGALGAIVYLVRNQQSALSSERASFAAEVIAGKERIAAELALRQAERDRDEAIAAAKVATAERDVALARLADAQNALIKARKEYTKYVVAAISSAPSGTAALAALDELFSFVPDVSGAADGATAGGGDGRGQTPAVHPAGVAGEAADGRRG